LLHNKFEILNLCLIVYNDSAAVYNELNNITKLKTLQFPKWNLKGFLQIMVSLIH